VRVYIHGLIAILLNIGIAESYVRQNPPMLAVCVALLSANYLTMGIK
jgi:hypothetical protein